MTFPASQPFLDGVVFRSRVEKIEVRQFEFRATLPAHFSVVVQDLRLSASAGGAIPDSNPFRLALDLGILDRHAAAQTLFAIRRCDDLTEPTIDGLRCIHDGSDPVSQASKVLTAAATELAATQV